MVGLTKRWLDSLKRPAATILHWDNDVRRFGVRATASGAISFVVQYRNAQGRSRRLTIGSYGTWTPDQARKEAQRLLRIVDGGGDPADMRRAEREAITFRQLASEYMDKAGRGLILGGKGRPKKAATVQIDAYRMPRLVRHFGDMPVKNIVRADCQRCLDGLMGHGPARAMGLLGGVLSYAVAQGYITSNPAHGIRKPADGQREFRLDAEGYRALGKALEVAESRTEPWQAVAAIRLVALTGCRKGEVLKLRLSEVDMVGRCLRLGDTKSGESMRALGEPALRVLKAAMGRPGRSLSPYVFPGRDPRKPFNGLGGAWERIVGADYTPHSLRHAFASACDELDLSELTIAMLLGHRSAKKGSTTRGYISKPDAVLLASADKVGRYIWQAMTGDIFGGEVIELTRTAAVA